MKISYVGYKYCFLWLGFGCVVLERKNVLLNLVWFPWKYLNHCESLDVDKFSNYVISYIVWFPWWVGVWVWVFFFFFIPIFRISKIWKFVCIPNNSVDIGGLAKKCNPIVLRLLSFLFTFAFAFFYIFSTILFFFKF